MDIDNVFLEKLKIKMDLLIKQYLIECQNKIEVIQKSDLIIKFIKPQHYADIGDIFSNSLLRHIDLGRCLYKQPVNKIRKGADTNAYYKLYYDTNNELVMCESMYSDNFKPVTIYLNKNIQATYLVDTSHVTPLFTPEFKFMEYSEYNNGNIVSCERIAKQYDSPYGFEISGEYYEYDGLKLIKAMKFSNYNTAYEPFCNPVLQFGFIPDRILNPDIFYYEFNYDDSERLICKKTHKYTSECDKEYIITLEKSELNKLKQFGVDCFMED